MDNRPLIVGGGIGLNNSLVVQGGIGFTNKVQFDYNTYINGNLFIQGVSLDDIIEAKMKKLYDYVIHMERMECRIILEHTTWLPKEICEIIAQKAYITIKFDDILNRS